MIAACIPSIPVRGGMLLNAIGSVNRQTRPVDEISIAIDNGRLGASDTRNRAWRNTSADWVAFLDDDDWWLPSHIERLEATQIETGADVVYPWFEGNDPFPQFEGLPWDNEQPHLFPICYLVRRELLEEVDGFAPPNWPSPDCANEDWPTILKYVEAGAKIVHLPERTWAYNWHGANTSGAPHKW